MEHCHVGREELLSDQLMDHEKCAQKVHCKVFN